MKVCFRRMLSTIVIGVFVAYLIRAVLGASLDRGNVIRRFNKHVLNPFALWVAKRRPMYYGVLHHTGRRSGTAYATPVVAKVTPQGIVIPLPYGSDTDWCRNVLAAGGCTLALNGEVHVLGMPEVVPANVAEPLVPPRNAKLWHRWGIGKYLVLKESVARTDAVASAA